MEQILQRHCGCPIPGSIQDQVGWSPEQTGLVKDIPAHGELGGLELDDF